MSAFEPAIEDLGMTTATLFCSREPLTNLGSLGSHHILSGTSGVDILYSLCVLACEFLHLNILRDALGETHKFAVVFAIPDGTRQLKKAHLFAFIASLQQ